ncbi:MAG TPA: AbrB/MazE/SpoVT family DNA-binding domain-containing protein [Thermoanaerobaculia bacterium]|jgi:AbrB family looped-hinge helix DNA binding protein|nr:AbrB/MazE/SpoVT family DNA-binding domain-containing protein [Thermoanaerobaculia bacterium]
MRTRLSTKGQLIIPKAIRERHGWSPGSELALEDRGDAVLIRSARPEPETTFEELVGCTGYRGPARSLGDMEHAIARGARERRENK